MHVVSMCAKCVSQSPRGVHTVQLDDSVAHSIAWQPLSVAVAAEQTSRGQFWARLSAFTALAIIVPVIVGWLTQKQLVRGLTSGAVK